MNSKKRCKRCRKYFPAESMVSHPVGTFCSNAHAVEYAGANANKKRPKVERLRRAEQKESIKTKKTLREEAQRAMNALRRWETRDLACPTCGKGDDEILPEQGWKPGGAWDAGHFLSVGSHPELRFIPWNIWRQCKSCNSGEGKYGRFHSKERQISEQYRLTMIDRMGLDYVEWLEGAHDQKHYTADELREIRDLCRWLLNHAKRN